MSNFKLTVHLKQITPLLHFQGDTEGACLRASEVKPKLDKFIVHYLGEENIPDSWKLSIPSDEDGTQHGISLNYKMRFSARGKASAEQLQNPIHHLYFGSMGEKNTDKVKNLYYPDGIDVSVLCLVKQRLSKEVVSPDGRILHSLLDVIDALLPAFFALHCFGTRSNKGFGSFEVENRPVSAAQLRKCLPAKCLALFDLQSSADNYGITERLDDVYVLSTMMKGGVNLSFGRNPAYYKGDIQSLLPANRIGSDKAFLKQRVFSEDDKRWYQTLCKKHHTAPNYSQYQFIRAMLGLTDTYTFGIGKGARKFSVQDAEGEIERFANPITFKPYENGILVLTYEISKQMLGRKFKFGDRGAVISTPTEFDIVKFTSHFLHQLNGKRSNPCWNSFHSADPSIKIKGRPIYFNDTLDYLSLAEEGGN